MNKHIQFLIITLLSGTFATAQVQEHQAQAAQAMIDAIQAGSAQAMKAALDSDIDASILLQRFSDKFSPLELIMKAQNKEINKVLMASLDTRKFSQITASQNLSTITYFLNIGLKIEQVEKPESFNALCKAVSDEDLDRVNLLLDYGFNPAATCSKTGLTPITFARIHSNKSLLSSLLARVSRYSKIDWHAIHRDWLYSDRDFSQHLLNEQHRIEALQGLKSSPLVQMSASREKQGFLGLILCKGHGFIHTNVPLFGAPIVKKYDNSTGTIIEYEFEGDEYIGFYPNQGEFQDQLDGEFRRKASSIAEIGTASGKSALFPSRRFLFLALAQAFGLSPLRFYLFGGAKGIMESPAILIDERTYYSDSEMDSCQRAYVDLDSKQWKSLSDFLYDAQFKIEIGELGYQLFAMNCVDFVRESLISTGKEKDLSDAFAQSSFVQAPTSSGFSVTRSWAAYRDKGFAGLFYYVIFG